MRSRTLGRLSRTSKLSAFVALLALNGAQAARAQEPSSGDPGQDQVSTQRELRELFAKVEKRLREIDRLLSDASAGDTRALEKVGSSGIEELLKISQVRGKEVVEGIDKILELAQKMPGQSGSSSGAGPGQGQPKPGDQEGQSPLDKQGDSSTQPEATPSGPEKKPGGQKPEKPGPDNPDGQQPDPRGKTPKDNRTPDRADGTNVKGAPPPPLDTQAPSAVDGHKDRWGDLPVHARDVFRTGGGGDMPAKYRDWIDAYYRRLNQKP